MGRDSGVQAVALSPIALAGWDGSGTISEVIERGFVRLDGGFFTVEPNGVWTRGGEIGHASFRNPARASVKGRLSVEVSVLPATSVECKISVANSEWQDAQARNHFIVAAKELNGPQTEFALRIRTSHAYIPSKDTNTIHDDRPLGAFVIYLGFFYDCDDLLPMQTLDDPCQLSNRAQWLRSMAEIGTTFTDIIALSFGSACTIQIGGGLLDRYRLYVNILYHHWREKNLTWSELSILRRFFAASDYASGFARQLNNTYFVRRHEDAFRGSPRDISAICNTVLLGGAPGLAVDSLLDLVVRILPTYKDKVATIEVGDCDANIRQFWDNEKPPPDVVRLMDRWRDYGSRYTRLSEVSARAWLGKYVSDSAVAQLDKCWHPAMKADLLRYHLLARSGGLWIDADENGPDPQNGYFRGLICLSRFATILNVNSSGNPRVFPGRYVTTGIIGANVKSRLMAAILQRIHDWIVDLPHGYVGTPSEIHQHTGPTVVNGALADIVLGGVTGVVKYRTKAFDAYAIQTNQGDFCFLSDEWRLTAYEGATFDNPDHLTYKSDGRNWRAPQG